MIRTRMKSALIAAIACVGVTGSAHAGRYEDLTKAFAEGPKAEVVAATFFGGDAVEEFVAAGQLKDGRIVVAGNSWGSNPPPVDATVIGKGGHSGADTMARDKKGRERIDEASPDRSGLIITYAPDMKSIKSAARFDWGVASIADLCVLEDGDLLIVGKTGPNAGSIKATPNCAYIARIGEKGLEWIQAVDAYPEAATRVWITKFGAYFRSAIKNEAAMFRIGLDGKKPERLAVNGAGNDVSDFHGVNSETGEFYYGGDRNTNTGKEPWRQPFMYVFDKTGKQTDTIWNWPSKMLRTKGYPAEGQVSDSSIRGVAIHPQTGELVINGWSDGGNSVFLHQPKDISERTVKPATSFSTWGMKNANSLAYIMRIDRKNWKMNSWCYWVSYVPDDFNEQRSRGAPNFASIVDLAFGSDGAIAFTGQSATGLIQTPGAFFKYANDGTKHGGWFAAVQSPDQKELYFSSYLPGSDNARVFAGNDGTIIIVSRTTGVMKHESGDQPAPTINAQQPTFGGAWDGQVIVLKTPK